MWQEIKFHLTSSAPLVMHNGELANPTNPIVKEIKKISSKRSKTDSDHEAMAHLEFLGGLYMGPNGDGPVIPAPNIKTTLYNAAKKKKEGPLYKMGTFVSDFAPLEYEGPRAPEELWQDKSFVDQRMVVVSRSRILRTRPIFKEWGAIIAINYEPELVNRDQVIEWAHIAGFQIGMLEMRPEYGRFEVEVLD